MAAPFVIEGLEELKEALEQMENKIRNKTIRQAQRAAMKVLAAEVKAEAPVESGKTKASVKVKAGKRKKDIISTIVEVGDEDNPMVAFVELGTAKQPANPFVRRSVAAEADDMGEIMGNMLKDSIENAG